MSNKQILLKKIKSAKENVLKVEFAYQKNFAIKKCKVEELPEDFDYAIAFGENFIFMPRCFNGNWWYEIIPKMAEIIIKENKITYIEG